MRNYVHVNELRQEALDKNIITTDELNFVCGTPVSLTSDSWALPLTSILDPNTDYVDVTVVYSTSWRTDTQRVDATTWIVVFTEPVDWVAEAVRNWSDVTVTQTWGTGTFTWTVEQLRENNFLVRPNYIEREGSTVGRNDLTDPEQTCVMAQIQPLADNIDPLYEWNLDCMTPAELQEFLNSWHIFEYHVFDDTWTSRCEILRR